MVSTTHRPTKKARPSGAASSHRRSRVKAEPAEELMEEEALEMREERPARGRMMMRLAFVPLREAYFVGLGAMDWMLEQAMALERDFSERGHRRSEAMSGAMSRMGAMAGEKTRALSRRGRERMRAAAERFEESMSPASAVPGMREPEPT